MSSSGAANSTDALRSILEGNLRGEKTGVYSICSANRFVLEAGMQQAKRDDNIFLVESTSNQVNQFGGYTGQAPAQFVLFVKEIADGIHFPAEQIVFGGDHLGPHVWQKENSRSAMAKGRELVRACVLAGYTKIHLDASMLLAEDSVDRSKPLADEIVSERAADLCESAEKTWRELPPNSPAPVYVIGTEVPIPGGETVGSHAPEVTRTGDLSRTIEIARKSFERRGLESAWQRVIAIVVQPGVEFGDETVFEYDPVKAKELSEFAGKRRQGVYEAHSTDYQSTESLRQMVRDHFAILKVGPWLTFAFREAVFALEEIEREWLGDRRGIALSAVRETLDAAMLADPRYWENYYHGDEPDLRFARKYSLSDRCRYYWPVPEVDAAVRRLIENLAAHPAPGSLLHQYLPIQSEAVGAGEITNHPAAMIRHKIGEVIERYAAACGVKSSRTQS